MHHPIHYGDFDADIYAFNCKNGTLHINTGEFTEHRSTDLLTKIVPWSMTPPHTRNASVLILMKL